MENVTLLKTFYNTMSKSAWSVGPQRIVFHLGRKIILEFQSHLIFRDGFSKLGISFLGVVVIVYRVGGGPFLVNQFSGASKKSINVYVSQE